MNMKLLKADPTPKKRSGNMIPPKYGAVLLSPKTLRRLPHVFTKVLELPIHSDAEVFVEETPDALRFVAGGFPDGGGVSARTVEVHPGVTKTVIASGGDRFFVDDLDLNLWRFRLPAATRPELATAVCSGGKLVLTVPKFADREGHVY